MGCSSQIKAANTTDHCAAKGPAGGIDGAYCTRGFLFTIHVEGELARGFPQEKARRVRAGQRLQGLLHQISRSHI